MKCFSAHDLLYLTKKTPEGFSKNDLFNIKNGKFRPKIVIILLGFEALFSKLKTMEKTISTTIQGPMIADS